MTIKQERAAHLIRNILSSLLMAEVTDPALQDVTITEVKVDREFEYADVYVRALGDDDTRQAVMAGLDRANGFLRRGLAQRVRLRKTPVLHFHWDSALEHAERIDSLLETLHQAPPPAAPEPEQDPDSDGDDGLG